MAYTTEKSDFIVIWITGTVSMYIAEVTQSKPLQLKVEEEGPYAHLKEGDFIIQKEDTATLQRDAREETCVFLQFKKDTGRKVYSGLKRLGVSDGRLHEILPG